MALSVIVSCPLFRDHLQTSKTSCICHLSPNYDYFISGNYCYQRDLRMTAWPDRNGLKQEPYC